MHKLLNIYEKVENNLHSEFLFSDMVRTYKRKTERGSYGEANLQAALRAIKNGIPINRVSNEFGVPTRTLRRHRDKRVAEPGHLKFGRYRNALPSEIELELKAHVLDMQRRLFGLGMRDMQKLAFDVAEKANIDHPFNKETKIAGKDWVQSFLARHILSLRQPQGTSVARAVGFNKPQVQRFFDLFKEVLESHGCQPSRVWNMDETGLTTVQEPGRVIAPKGFRQVGKITSAERGVLVTLICACNAAGVFLPPMYIFPRKRMPDTLMKDAPPQAVGYANPSGWTDEELFPKWLEHFTSITNCSTENRHVVLLDGHHSHKSLQAIEYCRDHGIELITLPPHSTHKLQPLDRCYFKSLKKAFSMEADNWMVTNPGRRITIHDMAGLTGKAFLRSAVPERAINGFRTCGLWPFDPNIFTDVDFVAAEMTEEDMPGTSDDRVEDTSPQQTPDNPCIPVRTDDVPDATATDCDAASEATATGVATATREAMASDCHAERETTAAETMVPGTDATRENIVPGETMATDTSVARKSLARGEASNSSCIAHAEIPPRDLMEGQYSSQGGLEVIQTVGDGRCLFRSLIIGMDTKLQMADRNELGMLTSPILSMKERSLADGLRAKMVDYMCDNYNSYSELDVETINGDLPPWLHYSSMEDRIAAIADPLSLPGELELTATSNVLNIPIVVFNNKNEVVQRYGKDTSADALMVQFMSVGQDVGHYNCVLRGQRESTSGQEEIMSPPSMPFIQPSSPDDHQPNIELSGLSTSMEPLATMATNPSSSFNEQQHSPPTQSIKEMIQSISPLPKVFPKRTRTRKTESAEVLTSSPYKAMLLEKKAKRDSLKKRPIKKRRKVSYGKKKTKKSNKKRRQRDNTGSSDEDEDWPCLICCEPYSRTRPGDIWVQCQVCHLWAHEECSPGLPQFVCPNCDSDDSEWCCHAKYFVPGIQRLCRYTLCKRLRMFSVRATLQSC